MDYIVLGSNFALLVKSPGDDGQQLLTTGSRLVCISLDALHIPVGRIFGSKFLECPHSSISGMLVWSTTPSPPKENLGRSWHFGLELVWSTPPSNENMGRSWHFGLELVWSTPKFGGARIWKLISVSPVDTISLLTVIQEGVGVRHETSNLQVFFGSSFFLDSFLHLQNAGMAVFALPLWVVYKCVFFLFCITLV